MALTAQEYEKNFLDNIVPLTGNPLKHWLHLAKSSGLSKTMELTNYFKQTHKLNHAHSSILAAIFLNDGKAAFANTDDLLQKQLKGKEHLKSLYEEIVQFILSTAKGTQVIPKVTYISFTGKKEFAAINLKKVEIRLGLALKNVAFTNEVQKAKITGPMSHITHMIVLTDTAKLNNQLSKLIKQAYTNRN